MVRIHKPHSGSKAFYPRVRARKETPSFSSFPAPADVKGASPLNFLAYKAGMVHGMGRNEAPKTTSFGLEVSVPLTVVEAPPLRVYGVRAYKHSVNGLKTVGEATVEKPDKFFRERVGDWFKRRKSKKKKDRPAHKTLADLEKLKSQVDELRLLVHSQPSLTQSGKKVADVSEVKLSGSLDEQFAYAGQKLGNELTVQEVFKERQFVDVKAVTVGHGFTGVVKRFGVKSHRPKAKTQNVVGSIGPWHPATVMWTVARAGQMGYHNRTEFNKRIVRISDDLGEVNPPAGFPNYGVVKNDYLLLGGSIPGPEKRAVALRFASRPTPDNRYFLSNVKVISPKRRKVHPDDKVAVVELEEKAAHKVRVEEEKKEAKKSAADLIKEGLEGKKK
ncbi:MAG TPA: 50S ribosomal protein L3 [Candidatus Diapherotrites archaeon]|uniref:50S ribosomal protein L3 n=1 Tax=Candidatus Iainarchaeum sp. TaxID=3101447 RepID=A0A7J4JFK9_9ARCH|nr:50S ribosomal protein L3 [Candidatus Diapherotrites archaeon]